MLQRQEREAYRHDDWTPDPERRRRGQPWPSVNGNVKPNAAGLRTARKVRREMGYTAE